MNNIILPPLYHITVHKHFDNDGFYVECVKGCFKVIFYHDFQRMDYTPHKKDGYCTFDTGLNYSAN